jgi:hypothetical protein
VLRHALATLVYRAAKTLRDAPPGFSAFAPGPDSRSAGQILAHLCDLMDWGASIAGGQQAWSNSPVGPWEAEVGRFFAAVAAFDAALAAAPPDEALARRLFQGPIADALQHTGQLAMMRRLAGAPIKGENYFVADIAPGRIGPEQAAPRREFD